MRNAAHPIQKLFGIAALLAGLAIAVLVIWWPEFVRDALVSRGWAGLLALWFLVVAGWVHPEFRRGLAEGFRR